MPHVISDRVLEASTSSGTGPFALSGAVLGYRAFSAVCAIADTVPYYIEAVDAQGRPTGDWEFGLGTYSAANQLTRTTIRGSSNGGLAVSFTAGTKLVGLGVPAPNSAPTRAEWRAALGLTAVGEAIATAADQAAGRAALGLVAPRGHIAGLQLSTPGASAAMTIGQGQATDATASIVITLASALPKTTAAWAVGSGNGGLDTGSIANNTWYHFHLIQRPDTGVVDVLFSLSPTAPTMPPNYTRSRRIGSGRTNGSGQWLRFFQDGDLFQWETPLLDVDVTNPGTAAVTRTLNVPTGVRVAARFNYNASDPTNANNVLAYFSDLSVADLAPSASAAPLASSLSQAAGSAGGVSQVEVLTNTSAQIRSRLTGAVAVSSLLRISTIGWRDSRGRDA